MVMVMAIVYMRVEFDDDEKNNGQGRTIPATSAPAAPAGNRCCWFQIHLHRSDNRGRTFGDQGSGVIFLTSDIFFFY